MVAGGGIFFAPPDHFQVTSSLVRYETVQGVRSAVVRSKGRVPIASSGNLPPTTPAPGIDVSGRVAFQGTSNLDITTWLGVGDVSRRIERVEATDRYDWTETTAISGGQQPPTAGQYRQSGTVSTRFDRLS